MITKEQAIKLGNGEIREEIHCTFRQECKKTIGKRGGVQITLDRVRVSGKCKTWKTRPNEFRLPVKFGLYQSLAITNDNCESFHLASDCPIKE